MLASKLSQLAPSKSLYLSFALVFALVAVPSPARCTTEDVDVGQTVVEEVFELGIIPTSRFPMLNCTDPLWVAMAVWVVVIVLAFAYQFVAAWMERRGVAEDAPVPINTSVHIPVWRSVIIQHQWFQVLVPCHSGCAVGHALMAAAHFFCLMAVSALLSSLAYHHVSASWDVKIWAVGAITPVISVCVVPVSQFFYWRCREEEAKAPSSPKSPARPAIEDSPNPLSLSAVTVPDELDLEQQEAELRDSGCQLKVSTWDGAMQLETKMNSVRSIKNFFSGARTKLVRTGWNPIAGHAANQLLTWVFICITYFTIGWVSVGSGATNDMNLRETWCNFYIGAMMRSLMLDLSIVQSVWLMSICASRLLWARRAAQTESDSKAPVLLWSQLHPRDMTLRH